ncbi:MAG TPA: penicillin-insensitive murein endopeptidase [Polyangiaceae bacterium]|jgi:penicillin-insensitive murein endopeptidase|nr:MAG: Penicillin-insensitive murein endopeptidase precursor [Deltaproteobacteria bacterium ADurb.Bin207]HNZ24199.1 penicillin-insensitive murein endopeptidase [Polyangiaceae bacterium]HOD22556.1 penicillin-insensitive murein endopeptidase [Polyangiaceae bacterium]HOE49448.1 penicillin-insensitive murein endopeptidase [Polyangiaceae bacterium]HOH01112.1 penicillin-insensitive murein endopeptidase [Polyangiaceae bacterium]
MTYRFSLFLGIAAVVSGAMACVGSPSPLVPEARGSVGLPYRGVLTEPVALPQQGTGYVRIKPAGKHYGTRALVQTIEYAAAEVQRQRPGPPLQIGDLSGPYGGRIPNHSSHRTGRDVDFIFYATDLGGAMVPAQGWTHYGADGLGIAHEGKHGRIYLRMDLERNWLLVKALLQAPTANVMWLFVSNPLRALLTEYAFARGEDPLIVWQAENVLHQPRNSLPHDDHFHLRIMCPEGSEGLACEQGGPVWPWLTPVTLDWPESSSEIATFIEAATIPSP